MSTVSRYIGSRDPCYHSLFVHDSWRELIEKADPGRADAVEIVDRIAKYLNSSSSPSSSSGLEDDPEGDREQQSVFGLPVAEAMVTYKERR